MTRARLLAVVFALVLTSAPPIAAGGTPTIIRSISVGDQPEVMTFDPSTQRLYVASVNSQQFTIVSTQDARVVGALDLAGQLSLGARIGFAAVSISGVLYLTSDQTNEIYVVRTTDGVVLRSIQQHGPFAVAVDDLRSRTFIVTSDGVVEMDTAS